jgi:hypothetical protein
VLLDDTLNARIRDVIGDYLDDKLTDHNYAPKDWVIEHVEAKISDHDSDYDHDDFVTKEAVKDLVEEAFNDQSFTPVDADDDDFRSAVCAAVRNSLG